MDRRLKLFVIPLNKLPGGPPNPAKELTIEASSLDGLRAAAQKHIEDENLKVRSISNGPAGIVAYAEEHPSTGVTV
jgi:hypothetical protein